MQLTCQTGFSVSLPELLAFSNVHFFRADVYCPMRIKTFIENRHLPIRSSPRINTDADSGPEVRKKIAHGGTVGMMVEWNKPRRGRQDINRERHENFRFNRKSDGPRRPDTIGATSL